MGAGCSSGSEVTGPLEALLVKAVTGAKSRKGMRDRKLHTFTALQMQFGKMRPGFFKMKNLHQSLAVPSSMRIVTLEDKLDLLQIDPSRPTAISIIQAAKAEGRGGIDGDE